jgi:SAM-dependent methyltransferase
VTYQKDAFLASEGDAWYRRNQATLSAFDGARDIVCRKIAELSSAPLRVLEIGCGDAVRLQYLAERHGHAVTGIDPSAEAVNKAVQRGVRATQGTADALEFGAGEFDVVIFGFCLYLCDDADLFRIAAEADRVLADPGWLLIFDFEARAPVYKPYHHLPGGRRCENARYGDRLWRKRNRPGQGRHRRLARRQQVASSLSSSHGRRPLGSS